MSVTLQFENLRSPLRQLALIPAGQGGLLTHAMATAVAAIKVSNLEFPCMISFLTWFLVNANAGDEVN